MAEKDPPSFLHSAHASEDTKMMRLRLKHGWEGMGIFWALIEKMRVQRNFEIAAGDELEALALHLSVAPENLHSIISTCVTVKLFEETETGYHAPALTSRMRRFEERSVKARQSALSRYANGGDTQCVRTAIAERSSCDAKYRIKNEEGSKKREESRAEIAPEPVEAPRAHGPNKRVLLTEHQQRLAEKFFSDRGLDVNDLRDAVRILDSWLVNNPGKASRRKDHRAMLCGWAYEALLKQRTTEQRAQNAGVLKPATRAAATMPVLKKSGLTQISVSLPRADKGEQ